MFDDQQPNKDPEDIFSGTDPAGQPGSTAQPTPLNTMPGMPPSSGLPGQPMEEPAPPQRGSKKLVVFAIVIIAFVIILVAVLVAMWIIRGNEPAPVMTDSELTNQSATDLLPVNPVPEGSIPSLGLTDAVEEPGDSSLSPQIEPEPLLPIDTDGDGLSDEEEEALGTNSSSADTDGDGLNDSEEVRVWNTDPLNIDSDGDGFSDGDEVASGYDPNQVGGVLLDINKAQ